MGVLNVQRCKTEIEAAKAFKQYITEHNLLEFYRPDTIYQEE